MKSTCVKFSPSGARHAARTEQRLGDSTLRVPRVGQGTMGMGGQFTPDRTCDADVIAALRLGIDSGLTLIDTAEVYGGGHAEELVGQAVRGIRQRAVIATKVSPEHLRPKDVIAACEASLQRLRTDYVDLYQVHWPNPAIPIVETMEAMRRLLEAGKIRAVGVSNFSVSQLHAADHALAPDHLVANQVEYNLFDRSVERDILPYCRQSGIALIAYSPLDQGALAGGITGRAILSDVARRYGCTPSQIALSWLIQHPSVIAIAKASRPEHVRQNAAAMDLALAPDDVQAIEEAFAMTVLDVPTDRIRVVLDGAGNRQAYQTLQEALENRLGFTPAPAELAGELRAAQEAIKPVRVRRASDPSGRFDWELVEGRIRYWAWVIAYGHERPIPVLVRQ